jgi:uncharacterized membrane protein YbhN (UPF0104 family)
MPFEELLRYTIPGYVALAPFLLLYLLFSTSAPSCRNSTPSGQNLLTAIIGILVLLGPAVGFMFQQIHMFVHEQTLYASPKRRTLALIIRKFREEEKKCILSSEALLAWDCTFRSNSETMNEGLRSHMLRTWYFIHSFRGVAWAFGAGFFILLIGAVLAWVLYWPNTLNVSIFVCVCAVAFVYLMSASFLRVKSYSTEQFLWPEEELTVIRNWEDIKKRLVEILRARGDITCYPGSRGAA